MDANLKQAVREYVDQLLSSRERARSAIGDVTPEEILVAARAAGHNAGREEVVTIAANSGVNVVRSNQQWTQGQDITGSPTKLTPAPNALLDVPAPPTPAPTLQVQESTAAPVPKVKHRKDYHWSIWKTTPTPQPTSLTPQPPTGRPTSSVPKRAWQTPDFRTPTPMGRAGADTPNDLKADYRDPLAAAQTAPKELSLQKHRENLQEENEPMYVPALKAWVSNANDYERDVAFNLLTSISGSNTRFKDCFRTGGHRRPGSPMRNGLNRPKTAGIRTMPMHLTAPAIEQHYIKLLGQSMDTSHRDAPRSLSAKPLYGSSLCPTSKHAESAKTRPRDYTHEASMFQNAQLPYKSCFTVHPEWISEHPGLQRNLKQMKTTKGPKGFRYSSK